MHIYHQLRNNIQANHKILPWWRQPYLWLVLSGPIAVVIACIITGVIIWQHPETMVAEDYYQQGININKTLSEKPQERTLAPAQQVRNHVMTPQVVKPEGRP